MRVIIIEEERFVEILELMKAESKRLAADSNTPGRLGWSKSMWEEACAEVQRNIHFHFVRWAQSHGASCVRR